MFNEQLSKTGVTYFDYYLLHDVGVDHYEVYKKLDCFNWLVDKKEKGLVKHIGFSFHDNADLLDKVLTEHPEMERKSHMFYKSLFLLISKPVKQSSFLYTT